MRKDITGSYIWGYHTETPSERKLSQTLKKAGLRFSQEVPVKGFTVDFLVDEWLIIEVDGESHLVSGKSRKDASRQKALEDSGFTVLRIPASDLSVQGGLNRWIKRIKELVASPPHLNRDKFENRDYKHQLSLIRKALAEGEAERLKRERMAYEGPRIRATGGVRGDEDSEGMEDYFGKDSENFASLLEKYGFDPAKKTGGNFADRQDREDTAGRDGSSRPQNRDRRR